MCYVCAKQVSLLWSMCDVLLNVFVFPKFLTIRGAVQGSFRATFGVASVFVHVVSRQDGELEDVSPLPLGFFSSVLI